MPGDDDTLRDAQRFYHATVGDYERGDVIRYPRRKMVRSIPQGGVDRLFEMGRQGSKICRNRAVFLIGLPSTVAVTHRHFAKSGASYPSGHVYSVEPHALPTKHDRRWVDELQARYAPLVGGKVVLSIRPDPALSSVSDAVLVENYWLGRQTEKPEWEYMTDQATVLEHVIQRVISRWFDADAFGR